MPAEPKGHPTEELPTAVNNQGLFSDYYLTELVRDDDFFQWPAKDAEAIWRAIKILYEKVRGQLATANEAQTEQLFIHPVLDLLGWRDLYAVQPPVPSSEGPRRPDFAFFGSIDDKEQAEATCKGKVEYFAKTLAVGDAKQWDRSLDRKHKGAGDAFTNANPSYQIDFYLRATDRTWGILTNGRRWRLYHRDTSYRMNVFYEVDLVASLQADAASFAYFLGFFRREAFATGFLDRAHSESRQYVGKLGDELKENVYEALRLLAEGLLKCPDNHLDANQLEEIRANTFVLIYRILFLFYAEDRDLLPMTNSEYRSSYSLRGWAQDIARRLDGGSSFSPTAYGCWGKLTELFRIVNEGDSHLGVPPYNGGLFDPEKHPLLVRWKIGDQYLVLAIDKLARAEASGRTGRGPVSYRDLDIRHLGSIYEGLLEHRLRQAHEDTAVVKEKDREVFVPTAKLGSRRALATYKAGEVFLETDKGERKATGSYYTPDYIVKYIVENTLGPLVDEKRQAIAKEWEELEAELKKSRGYDREHYQRKLAELENRLIEEILSIKVLDPAMGSGHFLVEAVDFLARALLEALGGAPEESDEEDIRWARREVVERCIYGVDVNPLAVELAKLSLWISTVAKDRPLSFLDHHLRLGNSLIGAWVKDLGRLPARSKKDKAAQIGEHVVGLFEGKLKERLPVVLGEVMELLRKPSDKVEDIREKEAIYDRILAILNPFKEVANAWVSTYFGNDVDEADYENALVKLSDPSPVWEREVRTQAWFAKTQEIVAARHFFHWELEFPEVFFEETGQRKRDSGFDAVIGNPPYDVLVGLKDRDMLEAELIFYQGQQHLKAGLGGRVNIYRLFVAASFQIISSLGRLGWIIPATILADSGASGLRRCLLDECATLDLKHFPEGAKVFPEVAQAVVVVVGSRGTAAAAEIELSIGCTLPDDLRAPGFRIPRALVEHLGGMSIPAVCPEAWGVLRKLSVYPTLGGCSRVPGIAEVLEGELNQTSHKGCMSMTPTDTRLIRGVHCGRYFVDLEAGPGPSYVDRGCLRNRLGDSTKLRHSASPRIILQGIANMALERRLIFCRAEAGTILGNSVNYLWFRRSGYSPSFLLAVLNSKLLDWRFRVTSSNNNVNNYEVESLPVRPVAFVTQSQVRVRLDEEAKWLYAGSLDSQHGNAPAGPGLALLSFVEECLKKHHQSDPELVRKHNADPLNKDWQIPEGALWEQSDVVHDLLAFLAEEMIRLNEEKQREMKNFLSWLEAELQVRSDSKGNTGIAALTGKTALKNYLGDYQKGEPELPFEEMWEILQKNKGRIDRKLSHEFMAELREAYDRSLAKLRPTKERLRLTDALIDQLVYRLYGLTDEEIRIVEEGSGEGK